MQAAHRNTVRDLEFLAPMDETSARDTEVAVATKAGHEAEAAGIHATAAKSDAAAKIMAAIDCIEQKIAPEESKEN
jgi:hypothetical protein